MKLKLSNLNNLKIAILEDKFPYRFLSIIRSIKRYATRNVIFQSLLFRNTQVDAI